MHVLLHPATTEHQWLVQSRIHLDLSNPNRKRIVQAGHMHEVAAHEHNGMRVIAAPALGGCASSGDCSRAVQHLE